MTTVRAFGDRRARVGLSVVAGFVIVAAAVAPQLSARVTGAEYRLRVAPVDPVDPFRGAYVALDYPDLPDPGTPGADGYASGGETVYLPLQRDGDLWRGTAAVRTPPPGPYLRCRDEAWRYRCGVESWFLPEGAAAATGKALAARTAIAVLEVDSRGHAALVDLRVGA